jgi:HTH-type transcriptional regulator/antitoxin HigA
MKQIRPLRTESDYDWALAEIAAYFEDLPEKGTPDADRFDLLSALIESYEARHWAIEPADPVEAIRYRMEIGGFTQADLARLLGSRPRASEIMNRKRPLTMPMAYKLHREWNIPAETLIRPYHLDR